MAWQCLYLEKSKFRFRIVHLLFYCIIKIMSSLGHFIGEKVERLRNNMLVLLLLLFLLLLLLLLFLFLLLFCLNNPQDNILVSTHLSVIYLYIPHAGLSFYYPECASEQVKHIGLVKA